MTFFQGMITAMLSILSKLSKIRMPATLGEGFKYFCPFSILKRRHFFMPLRLVIASYMNPHDKP